MSTDNPSIEQLRRFAAENPPPPEWLDGEEEDLFTPDPDTMGRAMICFCVCARDHKWDNPNAVVQCRCGRILEPMTEAEHAEAVRRHEEVGMRIAAANDMEPFIRLFRD
jgi:hypothetical protein